MLLGVWVCMCGGGGGAGGGVVLGAEGGWREGGTVALCLPFNLRCPNKAHPLPYTQPPFFFLNVSFVLTTP